MEREDLAMVQRQEKGKEKGWCPKDSNDREKGLASRGQRGSWEWRWPATNQQRLGFSKTRQHGGNRS